jgi:hypothetical protein
MTGPLNWTGGTMDGFGLTSISASGSLLMTSASDRALQRRIDNAGTVTFNAGRVFFYAGTIFNNLAGGVFNCSPVQSTDAWLYPVNGTSGAFNNLGTFNKNSAGRFLIYNGNNALAFVNTGTLNVNGGDVELYGGGSGTNGSLTSGNWNIANNATLAIVPGPAITMIGAAAKVVLDGPNSSFAKIDGLANNQGSFTIKNGRAFITSAALSNSGMLVVGAASTLKIINQLTNTGTLDNSSAVIIDYPTGGPSPRATIQSQINTARHGGAWDLAGITSSAARVASPKNTTLGVLEGTEFAALYGAGATFGGLTTDDSSVLIKYTYYGDTDFNGVVDFDDYSRTDSGFNQHKIGWLNGDFDGNGVVDFDDYSLIDLAFNTQTGVLRPALKPGSGAVGKSRSSIA